MDFFKKQAKNIYSNNMSKSDQLLNNPNKVFGKVGKAVTKANLIKGGSFITVLKDFKLLIELVKAYTRKEYTNVSRATIVAALAAVMYFVSPVDAIIDVIPGLGYIDDAFVVGYVVKKLHEELQAFKDWKDNRFFS